MDLKPAPLDGKGEPQTLRPQSQLIANLKLDGFEDEKREDSDEDQLFIGGWELPPSMLLDKPA